MRSDRFAEGLLSLVAPPDRAAAAVGDLMEDRRAQNGVWFWRSIARVACAMLARDLIRSPLIVVTAATVGWFVYMTLSALFAVALTLAWGLAYFFSHHTGAELLASALRLRFDWPPMPAMATYVIQAVAFFAMAPFQLGRWSAPYWRGRELTLVTITLSVWLLMSAFVPFVGFGVRAAPPTIPITVTFLLLGLLDGRFRPKPASS